MAYRRNPLVRGVSFTALIAPVLGASIVGFIENRLRPFVAKLIPGLFSGATIMGRLGPVGTTYLTTEATAGVAKRVNGEYAGDIRLGGHILTGYRLVNAIAPTYVPEFGGLMLPGAAPAAKAVAAGATAGAAAGALAGPAGAALGAAAGAGAAASAQPAQPSPYQVVQL